MLVKFSGEFYAAVIVPLNVLIALFPDVAASRILFDRIFGCLSSHSF